MSAPLVALLLCAASLAAEDAGRPSSGLRVAAASDLRGVLDDLARRFEAQRPTIDVQPTYGASGSLYAQIVAGAPFDVFLAADVDYARELADAGRCARGSVFAYARGRLALWFRRGAADGAGKGMAGLLAAGGWRALADPRIEAIAIANPRHAPYGRAAVAALERLGLLPAVEGRLVRAENVAQAAQLVQSGAADVGVIALSLASTPAMRAAGAFVEIPIDAYPPIVQGGCVVRRRGEDASSAVDQTAQAFAAFLAGDDARAIFVAHGFLAPDLIPDVARGAGP
jgi:molybdate transport system substrate-binding protein